MAEGSERIGICGVGLMGLGIATNIVKAGFPLGFLEHPGNQPTDGLTARGATAHPSGASLAGECDIVILCVTGSPEVEDILTREDGVLAGLRPGALVIDCSTGLPETTLRLAEAVRRAGGRFIDAPMTRTPKEAMEGRLNLIIGGAGDDVAAARPLFAAFAENVIHVGPVGAGHVMKLVHNFVSLGFSAVLAEAVAAARRAAVPQKTLLEVLAGGAGKGVVLDRFAPHLLEGDPSGLQFTLANARKDIGYYCRMAAALGAENHAGNGVLAVFDEAVEAGRGSAFVPELVEFLSAEK